MTSSCAAHSTCWPAATSIWRRRWRGWAIRIPATHTWLCHPRPHHRRPAGLDRIRCRHQPQAGDSPGGSGHARRPAAARRRDPACRRLQRAQGCLCPWAGAGAAGRGPRPCRPAASGGGGGHRQPHPAQGLRPLECRDLPAVRARPGRRVPRRRSGHADRLSAAQAARGPPDWPSAAHAGGALAAVSRCRRGVLVALLRRCHPGRDSMSTEPALADRPTSRSTRHWSPAWSRRFSRGAGRMDLRQLRRRQCTDRQRHRIASTVGVRLGLSARLATWHRGLADRRDRAAAAFRGIPGCLRIRRGTRRHATSSRRCRVRLPAAERRAARSLQEIASEERSIDGRGAAEQSRASSAACGAYVRYSGSEGEFELNFTRQDAILLNLQRACEAHRYGQPHDQTAAPRHPKKARTALRSCHGRWCWTGPIR